MSAVWKDIPSCPGYQASSLGQVRSLDRMVRGKDGRDELHRGKILKAQVMKNGYLEVFICDGQQRRHRTVHSLVAEAFLGAKPEGQDVMHLNGDRSDNSPSNLAYGSRSENLHSTYSYGGKQANGKLSLEDVDNVRGRLDRGESAYSIAADYKVHPSAIYHIRDRKSFAWYGGGDGRAGDTCSPVSQ